MAGLIDNFFVLETALMARVQTELGNRLRAVLSGNDIDSLSRLPQLTPAAYVLYQDYDVLEQLAAAGTVRLKQSWLVVLAVAQMRTPITGEAARSLAGPLLHAILSACLGWRAGPGLTPLELARAPTWQMSNGVLHFPLAFTTVFTIGA